MTYRELQSALKAFIVKGYSVEVKLNAKKEILQAEYERLMEVLKFNNWEIDNNSDSTETVTVSEEVRNLPKSKRPNGVVLHRGLSPLDNKTPIVVIATGISKNTANPKTGNEIQTWIIVENTYPTEAVNSGDDSAICGNCPHRKNTETGKRTCYVNLMGVASVYRAYHKGNYPTYDPALHSDLFEGRTIRYGAYGDPVLIPTRVIHHLSNYTKGHTGYTHQWRNAQFERYQEFFMASVDSLIDFCDADSAGWSTFRVLPTDSKSTGIACKGGVKTTCSKCLLCNGTTDKQRHVSIHAHGGNAKHVTG